MFVDRNITFENQLTKKIKIDQEADRIIFIFDENKATCRIENDNTNLVKSIKLIQKLLREKAYQTMVNI